MYSNLSGYDDQMRLTIVVGTGKENKELHDLASLRGIFVDANLDLYVANCENHRVILFQSEQMIGRIVASDGSPKRTTKLKCPSGIQLNSLNYLYILDSHRIISEGLNGLQFNLLRH